MNAAAEAADEIGEQPDAADVSHAVAAALIPCSRTPTPGGMLSFDAEGTSVCGLNHLLQLKLSSFVFRLKGYAGTHMIYRSIGECTSSEYPLCGQTAR
jgi:hypothetical protein